MPTFWFSRHSRCLRDYQAPKHIRLTGNPGFLRRAHTSIRIPLIGGSFLLASCWRQPTYGTRVSKSNRVSSSRLIFFHTPEGLWTTSKAPDWLPANFFSVIFSSHAQWRITLRLNGMYPSLTLGVLMLLPGKTLTPNRRPSRMRGVRHTTTIRSGFPEGLLVRSQQSEDCTCRLTCACSKA